MSNLKDQRIVVLGASGRVGYSLCERLASKNRVVGVSRFRNAEIATNLQQLGVETFRLDLAHDDLAVLPRDADWLFIEVAFQHGAEENPQLAEATNVHLPARAMQYFRGVKGVVFASTGNVYGLPGRIVTEDDREAPIGVYGLTRYAGEQIVKFLSQEHKIPTIILRYFYGNDERYGIVKKIAETLIRKEELPLWMGMQVNCIAHDELVERTLKSGEFVSVPPLVMNLTSSNPYSIPHIIDLIAARLQIKTALLERIDERNSMNLAARTPIQDRLLGPTKIGIEDIVEMVCKALC